MTSLSKRAASSGEKIVLASSLTLHHLPRQPFGGKVHLFGNVYSDTLLGAFFLGFPCHHYFVDQFIWKPSRDQSLRRDLNLESGSPVPAL